MTTTELCQRTRITHREIQWWCDRGIIRCRRTDRGYRDFDETQILTVAIVAQLRRKGVTLQRIRQLRIAKPAGEYLVLNGGAALVWCSEQELIPCVAACPGACLVVSVEDLRKRLYDENTPRFSRRSRK